MKVKYTALAYLALNHEQQLEPHVDIFANGTLVTRDGKLAFDNVIADLDESRLMRVDCFINVPEWVCGLYFITETEFEDTDDINLNDITVRTQCLLVKSFQAALKENGKQAVRNAIMSSGKKLGFNLIELDAFFKAVSEFEDNSVVENYIDTIKGIAYNEYLEDSTLEGCKKALYEIVLNM